MYNIPYHGEKDLSKLSFLVTGGAGFIGSNLVAYLLKFGAGKVRVLDDFSTGTAKNLESFTLYPSFEVVEGDILNLNDWKKAVSGIDIILHATCLEPKQDLMLLNDLNIKRLNMMIAANVAGVKRIVDAACSFLYVRTFPGQGDEIDYSPLPDPVTKYVNAFYADLLSGMYGTECIGLRYFNVFGPHLCSDSSDIISAFISSFIAHKSPSINAEAGSRGFTYIENVVQANIIAALSDKSLPTNKVYKIEKEDQTSLTELAIALRDVLALIDPEIADTDLSFSSFKPVDAPVVSASSEAAELPGYDPCFTLKGGLLETVKYYMKEDKSLSVFH